MATTFDDAGPCSYEEFEQQFRLHFSARVAVAAWSVERGARAATLARRAGACDGLITAALVHSFAATAAHGPTGASASAALLQGVFPGSVLEPLCQIDGADVQAPAPRRDQALRGEVALKSRAVRLKGYIDAAARCDDKALPIDALLTIARRTSLDG